MNAPYLPDLGDDDLLRDAEADLDIADTTEELADWARRYGRAALDAIVELKEEDLSRAEAFGGEDG